MAAAKDPSQQEEAATAQTTAVNGEDVKKATPSAEGPSTEKTDFSANLKTPGKSLADRRKVPTSFYLTVISTVGLQVFSGMLQWSTLTSLKDSVTIATVEIQNLLTYTKDLSQSIFLPEEQRPPLMEYVTAAITTSLVVSIIYVLFIAPFMGGFWTGRRSRKHIMHRYMGLLYLTQYGLAWVEFSRSYDSFKDSFLPATIALNGLVQAWSAFFTFKVLPELNDAGYYADKAVISRSFVHENAFFTLMTVFGSMYYNDSLREALRSNIPGRILEYAFMFWPYIAMRPLFPITRFKDAGSTHKGRSAQNQQFYEVGTYLVKIFFLYAKYFLGFYINFLIFLDLPTREDWTLIRGCLLLNIGTVSIAIFLHTLRFKKILPPRLTFGLYLAQIYATILGIPYAQHVFTAHPKLVAVCFAGLLCNMTRSRKMHAAWCFVTMCLLSYKEIEW